MGNIGWIGCLEVKNGLFAANGYPHCFGMALLPDTTRIGVSYVTLPGCCVTLTCLRERNFVV